MVNDRQIDSVCQALKNPTKTTSWDSLGKAFSVYPVGLQAPSGAGGAGDAVPRSLVDSAALHVKKTLSRYSSAVYNLYSDYSMMRILPKIRGNAAYDYFLRSRVAAVNADVVQKVKASENCVSNSVFVTLTTISSAGDSFAVAAGKWREHRKHLSQFVARMRRLYGLESFLYGIESNGSGGLHVHALLILNKEYRFHRVVNHKKIGKVEKSFITYRNDDIDSAVIECWGTRKRGAWISRESGFDWYTVPHGWIDCKMVQSAKDATDYVTKEITKSGGAESSLKRWDKQQATDADKKRILTYALSGKAHIRVFGVSRDIKSLRGLEDDSWESSEMAAFRDQFGTQFSDVAKSTSDVALLPFDPVLRSTIERPSSECEITCPGQSAISAEALGKLSGELESLKNNAKVLVASLVVNKGMIMEFRALGAEIGCYMGSVPEGSKEYALIFEKLVVLGTANCGDSKKMALKYGERDIF